MESNLQSKPEWLDYYSTETKNTLDIDYGFDGTGMWFYGDVGNEPSYSPIAYPIRTNFEINGSDATTIIFTFEHGDVSSDDQCSDQGICIFNTNTDPLWCWENNNDSRIAVQFNCGYMELSGTTNFVGGEGGYEMNVGETYTNKVVYEPASSKVTAYLYVGESTDSAPVQTLSINDKLSGSGYMIGFDADKDGSDGPSKSYFTYLSIASTPFSSLCPAETCSIDKKSGWICPPAYSSTNACSCAASLYTKGAYVPAITVCNQRLKL